MSCKSLIDLFEIYKRGVITDAECESLIDGITANMSREEISAAFNEISVDISKQIKAIKLRKESANEKKEGEE